MMEAGPPNMAGKMHGAAPKRPADKAMAEAGPEAGAKTGSKAGSKPKHNFTTF
jgi:hypothetical protein